jgi:hypothetical protein
VRCRHHRQVRILDQVLVHAVDVFLGPDPAHDAARLDLGAEPPLDLVLVEAVAEQQQELRAAVRERVVATHHPEAAARAHVRLLVVAVLAGDVGDVAVARLAVLVAGLDHVARLLLARLRTATTAARTTPIIDRYFGARRDASVTFEARR